MVSEFGRVLLELLDRKNLTCYSLSEATGLGPEVISRIVNGKRPPTERHVLKLIPPLLLTGDDLGRANRLLEAADQDIFRPPRARRRSG